MPAAPDFPAAPDLHPLRRALISVSDKTGLVEAAKVLAADMRLNMALPCRISVYTQAGKTMFGLIRPEKMLAALSNDPALLQVAKEVEAATIRMVEEAK